MAGRPCPNNCGGVLVPVWTSPGVHTLVCTRVIMCSYRGDLVVDT